MRVRTRAIVHVQMRTGECGERNKLILQCLQWVSREMHRLEATQLQQVDARTRAYACVRTHGQTPHHALHAYHAISEPARAEAVR